VGACSFRPCWLPWLADVPRWGSTGCLLGAPHLTVIPSPWPAAVEFAEPDYLVRVDWEPNDSLMRAEWHHTAINSRTAWNVSRGSSLVKVCPGCTRAHAGEAAGSVRLHHQAGGPWILSHAPPPCRPLQVCHIDSGVRTDHPDLKRRVLKGWNLVPEVQVGARPARLQNAAQPPPVTPLSAAA
jgi:hypothetical protein